MEHGRDMLTSVMFTLQSHKGHIEQYVKKK